MSPEVVKKLDEMIKSIPVNKGNKQEIERMQKLLQDQKYAEVLQYINKLNQKRQQGETKEVSLQESKEELKKTKKEIEQKKEKEKQKKYQEDQDEYDDEEYEEDQDKYDDEECEEDQDEYDDEEYEEDQEEYDDEEYEEDQEEYDDEEYEEDQEEYDDEEYEEDQEEYDDEEYEEDQDKYDDEEYEEDQEELDDEEYEEDEEEQDEYGGEKKENRKSDREKKENNKDLRQDKMGDNNKSKSGSENIEKEKNKREKSKNEKKETADIYPKKLSNKEIERIYIGLLLDNPKAIIKYYFPYEVCYFEDPEMLNIYKSVLFTEGGRYTLEVAKRGFNFARTTEYVYRLKYELKTSVQGKNYNMEKVFTDLMKLFILRKNFQETPTKELQEKIVEIADYKLYDKMSIDEINSAVNQVTITGKFKQAVLNKGLTKFLEEGSNNLTHGLQLPFPILNSVFKGIRKGETMAYAMPSNTGKSRYTINIAAYTALVHQQKVLIISNEMSEEKMRLCLITTIINNPEIQKLHGQKLHISEGQLLEFKFKPDDPKKVEVDKEGYVIRKEKETQKQFAQRLKEVSSDFQKVIKVTRMG